jgi:hypothetical protein
MAKAPTTSRQVVLTAYQVIMATEAKDSYDGKS